MEWRLNHVGQMAQSVQDYSITPKQYILKKRIYNAEALLQNTQYNINEIAQIIGYDNPLYFSRVFQKTKGISPSEYRKNISQRVFNSPSL